MKQKLIKAAVFFSLAIGFFTLLPASVVEAQINPGDPDVVNQPPGTGDEKEEETCDPAEDTCCGDVKTSIIGGDLCGDSKDPGEGGTIYKLLIGALNILTAGIGVAAVGGIGYGALLYTTAESKPDQTKKAIGIITNVVIGIVAYALMYVFLNFLIPGGIFS